MNRVSRFVTASAFTPRSYADAARRAIPGAALSALGSIHPGSGVMERLSETGLAARTLPAGRGKRIASALFKINQKSREDEGLKVEGDLLWRVHFHGILLLWAS